MGSEKPSYHAHLAGASISSRTCPGNWFQLGSSAADNVRMRRHPGLGPIFVQKAELNGNVDSENNHAFHSYAATGTPCDRLFADHVDRIAIVLLANVFDEFPVSQQMRRFTDCPGLAIGLWIVNRNFHL